MHRSYRSWAIWSQELTSCRLAKPSSRYTTSCYADNGSTCLADAWIFCMAIEQLCTHLSMVCDSLLQADTKVIPSSMVPSIKVLALRVNFCVQEEIAMLVSFLRCFPNVETLHIEVTPHTLIQLGYSHSEHRSLATIVINATFTIHM